MSKFVSEFEKFLATGNKSLADCWQAAWNARGERCIEICKNFAGQFNAHRIGECAEAIEKENEQ